MSEVKHTPRPWSIRCVNDLDIDWSVEAAGSMPVCDVYASSINPQSEANARLIAAAPELLEAMVALEKWFDTDQEILDAMPESERADNARQLVRIRAAIAKAKGAA